MSALTAWLLEVGEAGSALASLWRRGALRVGRREPFVEVAES